jgi:AraC-like DNA-binding protein
MYDIINPLHTLYCAITIISTQIGGDIMQKQPRLQSKIHFNYINWPEDFPYQILKRSPITKNINNLHFHEGLEIGICYEGSGLLSIFNKVMPFSSGDVDIVLAGQPHAVVSSKHEESFWHFLIVDTEQLFSDIAITEYNPIAEMLYNRHYVPPVIRKGQHEDIHHTIEMIFYELDQQLPGYQYTVKALLWALLLKVTRIADSTDTEWQSFCESASGFSVITPAINYISNNFGKPILIKTLADLCFLSETHFNRIFKKIMRQSPLAYLIQVRIRMASMFLKTTDMSMADIALEVGFQSVSSFNRHFKSLKNIPPKDYRKKYR